MTTKVSGHVSNPALWIFAAGIWIFTDIQHMWTPSLITIFGQAAATPAELMGAFAVACVAIAFVPLFMVRGRGARSVLVVSMGLMVIARIALQFTEGGRQQLWIASVGIAVGVTWMCLAASHYSRFLVSGLAWGLALSTVTHAALGTWGAIWRDDAWAWSLLTIQIVMIAVAYLRLRASDEESPRLGRRAAVLLFPIMLLTGIVFSNGGRASAIGGSVGLVCVCLAAVLGIWVAGIRVRRFTMAVAVVALIAATGLAMMVEVTVDGVPGVSPVWVLPAFLVGLPAAVHLLAAANQGRRGSPLAVACGAIIWIVGFFIYYAGYDLGYRADEFIVVLAVVVAVFAASSSGVAGRSQGTPMMVLAPAAVIAVVAALVGPSLTISPIRAESTGGSTAIHFAAYNLRMGYGMKGTFDPEGVAQVLNGADVAVISEVDRGWLLNGGQDQLRILARLLDMHLAFGPAADPMWGDAILSRTPLHDVKGHAFQSYGAVTGAQALSATIDFAGQDLTIISTHLQPANAKTNGTVQQATDLAELMRERARNVDDVIMGGDLNTTRGSTAWNRLLSSDFTDALANYPSLLTSPADRPTEQIDHVFSTPGLHARKAYVKNSQLSDHLPVFVDFTLG